MAYTGNNPVEQAAYEASHPSITSAPAAQPSPPAQPTPSSSPSPSTATPTTPTSPTGSNPFALSQVMTQLQSQYKTNNDLMTNRNIALNVLYGMPVSNEDMAKLDPTLQQVLKSGDKNQIEMQIRLINDQVSGRANTLDSSVQFLTNAYTQQQAKLEQQRNDSIGIVQQFAATYGLQAKQALTSLYGQDYVNQLESQGVNIDQLARTNLLTQIKSAKITTPYVAVGQEIVDAATGQGFTDPQDFQTKTGMTLAEAGSKGLITTLNQTSSGAKSGDTEIVKVGGHEVLVNKLTGATIKDLGVSSTTPTPSNPTKLTISDAENAVLSKWKSEGYIQGNGKISSTDYKEAKAWWTSKGLSAASFDIQFSDLIDQSSSTWKADYGYKGN